MGEITPDMIRRNLESVRYYRSLWTCPPPRIEARPSFRQEAEGRAPDRGAAVRTFEFSIPGNRSRKISDGGLHGAGAWSWLLDRLYVEQDGGFSKIECLPADGSGGGGGRTYRVTVRADAVGRLREILEEACDRFCRKRVRGVFCDNNEVMKVRRP
jgi:hypothetical protein